MTPTDGVEVADTLGGELECRHQCGRDSGAGAVDVACRHREVAAVDPIERQGKPMQRRVTLAATASITSLDSNFGCDIAAEGAPEEAERGLRHRGATERLALQDRGAGRGGAVNDSDRIAARLHLHRQWVMLEAALNQLPGVSDQSFLDFLFIQARPGGDGAGVRLAEHILRAVSVGVDDELAPGTGAPTWRCARCRANGPTGR